MEDGRLKPTLLEGWRLSSDDLRFQSFLQGGFESSTHRRADGRRLDLTQATRHDEFALTDYELLGSLNLHTVRESARWHLIEETQGTYDFRSLEPILAAAERAGSEIILDLLHFGWPDHVDPLSETFPAAFRDFTRAVVMYLQTRREPVRYVAPINEISFLSWAGGEVGCLNPGRTDCAQQLKRNLVRAAVLSSEVLLAELRGVRLVAPEPVIHVASNSQSPAVVLRAQNHRRAQYEAWDMLSGRLEPELGGQAEYLDILGANFYERNQWIHGGKQLRPGDPLYRPFRDMLEELWTRYRRPILISETGAEDDRRAGWFHYVCEEVRQAMQLGIPVKGICLYPIVNHPGWDDDRHCYNALFDYPDADGKRAVYEPLAEAILAQQQLFTQRNQFRNESVPYETLPHEASELRHPLPLSSAMGLRVPAAAASDEPLRENTQGLLFRGAGF